MKGIILLLLSILPLAVHAEVNIRTFYGDWDYYRDNSAMTYTTDDEGNHIGLTVKATSGVMTIEIIEIFAPRCIKSMGNTVRKVPPIRIGKQWITVQEYCTSHCSVTIAPVTAQGNLSIVQLLQRSASIELYNSKVSTG